MRSILRKAIAGTGVFCAATAITLATAGTASAAPAASQQFQPQGGVLEICSGPNFDTQVQMSRIGQFSLTSGRIAAGTCGQLSLDGSLGRDPEAEIFVQGDFGNGFQDLGVPVKNSDVNLTQGGRVDTSGGIGIVPPRVDLRDSVGITHVLAF
jgi:hypothetical protein